MRLLLFFKSHHYSLIPFGINPVFDHFTAPPSNISKTTVRLRLAGNPACANVLLPNQTLIARGRDQQMEVGGPAHAVSNVVGTPLPNRGERCLLEGDASVAMVLLSQLGANPAWERFLLMKDGLIVGFNFFAKAVGQLERERCGEFLPARTRDAGNVAGNCRIRLPRPTEHLLPDYPVQQASWLKIDSYH